MPIKNYSITEFLSYKSIILGKDTKPGINGQQSAASIQVYLLRILQMCLYEDSLYKKLKSSEHLLVPIHDCTMVEIPIKITFQYLLVPLRDVRAFKHITSTNLEIYVQPSLVFKQPGNLLLRE